MDIHYFLSSTSILQRRFSNQGKEKKMISTFRIGVAIAIFDSKWPPRSQSTTIQGYQPFGQGNQLNLQDKPSFECPFQINGLPRPNFSQCIYLKKNIMPRIFYHSHLVVGVEPIHLRTSL